MEEQKWVHGHVETLFTDKAFLGSVCKGVKLFFEGRSPRNAILLLLLNVFARQVRGVVQQRDVPLHKHLAVVARPHAVVSLDLLGRQALDAEIQTRSEVEVLQGLVVLTTHRQVLRCARQGH